MRTVAMLAALAIAGCAHQEAAQPKTITKTVYRDKIVEKVVYVCRPEPPGGCNSIKERDACLSNKRCNWAVGKVVSSHCKRIYCRD